MSMEQPISGLKKAERIPQSTTYVASMGDGSGTMQVSQELLTKEVGETLKVGDPKELQTEDKESIVAAINEVKNSGGGSVDILETPEEIEANTEPEKIAGALAMKEMFSALNDKINDNILTYNESEDAYYIQHGADAVPKKLGSGAQSGTLTIGYTYQLLTNYGSDFSSNNTPVNVTGTITITMNDGEVTNYVNSGGVGVANLLYQSTSNQFRGKTTNFRITSVVWDAKS